MEKIRFLYNEPAAVILAEGIGYLVIGDIHIGLEREFSKKGIHVHDAAERMAEKVKKLMKESLIKRMIILGDVKNSILFPDIYDARAIKSFFGMLEGFDVTVVAGNHDAHLDEIVDVTIERDLAIGDFSFLHGDKSPDEDLMKAEYMMSAHNHVAVRMKDRNGRFYDEKAWLISEISAAKAKEFYNDFNKKMRLVVMPAFNDLIIGTPIGRNRKDSLNPLIRNGIFSYRKRKIYTLRGELVR